MDFEHALGLNTASASNGTGAAAAAPASPAAGLLGNGEVRRHWLRLVNLHLTASGLPAARADARGGAPDEAIDLPGSMLESFHEKARLLSAMRCPADRRIEAFLAEHFADLAADAPLRLPGALVLPRHGVARELSLPAGGDAFSSPVLKSYRLRNGVLHNPASDRRTTQGTFHVAEGGLPVPGDKKAVPKSVFAAMFRAAVNPPADLLTLPFTGGQSTEARSFVSLLLRPLVCPAVPGVCPEKSMEVRFFAPGSLVSNLDFVESIFGNAGDPFLPRNDAGLDVEHWTGHTGCVLLAPHLVRLTKKELGLPHVDRATPRQRRDGMCWASESERYNEGSAFKLTCRTPAGVIVTIIADNYYGYCKKEVKTQISYAANLYGNVEEEHAGGAIAFTSYSFGDEYQTDSRKVNGRTFADVARDYGGSFVDVRPEGYGVDRRFPAVVYIPEDARASTTRQQVWWHRPGGEEAAIPMAPGKVYVTPSGFKLRIEKHPGAPSWRIIGTQAQGTFCHKPCTVSGGGKSEISKSLRDYMIYGPIFVADIQNDLDVVDRVFQRNYQDRWRADAKFRPDYSKQTTRPILSPQRSLGSVIKLLTPSSDYTDAYNAWLASIPNYVYPIVFIIKRFYRPEWGADWRLYFNVDIVNGFPGHELKYRDRQLVGTYLRVGLTDDTAAGGGHAWRTYKVRQDFAAASKIQTEDDISASVVVPAAGLKNLGPAHAGSLSVKFVSNCEYRLFQRPDDAVHRGLDKQTETDMARPDNFISNFEPLTGADAAAMVEKVTQFDQFTDPMKKLLRSAASGAIRDGGSGDGVKADGPGYVVCSANPRLVDGKPSKNPRYLQIRPDLLDPIAKYVAEVGLRLYRAIPAGEPVYWPVDAVLVGRRNNPPEPARGGEPPIRPLAVYNPIHYQELPELFMDFVCSLTGKSPSTTGAGSEGALTKSPFNALRPTADLNTALVSYVLTGLGGFSTAAGYVGPHVRVDHDVSLLVPEIWCRLTPEERSPAHMIEHGYLEPLKDFDHDGETVLASRLGYRITEKFVRSFFGRIFDNPLKVFDEPILRPETQDFAAFVDGIKNITEAQQRVARGYFEDSSIDAACPPLRALLGVMANGSHEGMTAHDPAFRRMFTRDALLESDWYRQRLTIKQQRDVALWQRHVAYLESVLAAPAGSNPGPDVAGRLRYAAAELAKVRDPAYLQSLVGTLGADPVS